AIWTAGAQGWSQCRDAPLLRTERLTGGADATPVRLPCLRRRGREDHPLHQTGSGAWVHSRRGGDAARTGSGWPRRLSRGAVTGGQQDCRSRSPDRNDAAHARLTRKARRHLPAATSRPRVPVDSVHRTGGRMMANETDVQRSMATIRNIEGFPLFVHVTRLLALGQPVPVARLAQTAGWTVEEVEAALARHPAVERDEEGRLVGLGATLRPTAHRFTFSGGTLYGWCVSDALMFPVLLGQGGTVTSRCPVTETPILIEVSPDGILSVDPPEAVVTRVRPEGPVDDVRTSLC